MTLPFNGYFCGKLAHAVNKTGMRAGNQTRTDKPLILTKWSTKRWSSFFMPSLWYLLTLHCYIMASISRSTRTRAAVLIIFFISQYPLYIMHIFGGYDATLRICCHCYIKGITLSSFSDTSGKPFIIVAFELWKWLLEYMLNATIPRLPCIPGRSPNFVLGVCHPLFPFPLVKGEEPLNPPVIPPGVDNGLKFLNKCNRIRVRSMNVAC